MQSQYTQPVFERQWAQALAVIRDITELRRTKKLRESEMRYRSLFENSMDGILLTTPDGRILDANPAACFAFGRTWEEIIAAGRDGLMDMSDPAMIRGLERTKAYR